MPIADIRRGSLDMRHQMTVGSSKITIFCFLRRYIFPKLIYETKIIISQYVVPHYELPVGTVGLFCLVKTKNIYK